MLKESEGDSRSRGETDGLKGYQRKYLRSLAHALKPVLLVGQKGITGSVISSLEEALGQHELIKIKFLENKAKADKFAMLETLQNATGSFFVGMVGHIATLYRPNPNERDQHIRLPKKEADQ